VLKEFYLHNEGIPGINIIGNREGIIHGSRF